MSDALTSSLLIESVKRKASIPTNQNTFTDEDILEFANEEMRLGIVPDIMVLHEDYLLYELDIPIEANRDSYEIPSRAVGNKLRDAQWKVDEKNFIEMTRVGIGNRFFEHDVRTGNNLKKYYIKNNKLVFVPPVGPNPSYNDILTMVFYIKPSKLVSEDRVSIIQGINRNTGEIVLDKVPDVFTSQVTYDFYKGGSPFSVLNIDMTISSINTATNTVTFPVDSIPVELQVGDHLSLSEECMIPQVPNELQVMLSQMVVCRVLESLGDTQGLQNSLLKLEQYRKAAGMIIDNRVEDSPQKIVNRHGLVRTSIFSKRFNRR